MTRSRILLAVVLLPGFAAADPIPLRQGWMIRSSAGMTESGAVLSTTSYKPAGWQSATLPSTGLTALGRNKGYPDPYVAHFEVLPPSGPDVVLYRPIFK